MTPSARVDLRSVDRMLALARSHLGVDVAYVAELSDGEQRVQAIDAAEGTLFDPDDIAVLPEEQSFCFRMVSGEIPNAIADTRANDVTGKLDLTKQEKIGCYIGVPVVFSDGRVYGSFCGLSQKTRAQVTDNDVRLMRLLARLVADTLEREQLEREKRKLETENVALDALLVALSARDGYTGAHSDLVLTLAQAVAQELALDETTVAEVKQVALLHDIGKIGVPDSILRKEGPLTEDEWKIMKTHPAIGASIVGGLENLKQLVPAVRAEHEHWDGNGYPHGLAGEAIPLASRIVLACDAWHAMTSDRPYRHALSLDDACKELERGAGSQFDPTVVEALLRVLASTYGVGRSPCLARAVAE